MITLHKKYDNHNTKVLLNPDHIVVVENQISPEGVEFVELYHLASRSPLYVTESFEDIQIMIHQSRK